MFCMSAHTRFKKPLNFEGFCFLWDFKIKAAGSESSNQEEEEHSLDFVQGDAHNYEGVVFYFLLRAGTGVHAVTHCCCCASSPMQMGDRSSCHACDKAAASSSSSLLICVSWPGSSCSSKSTLPPSCFSFFLYLLLKGRTFCLPALALVQHTPRPVWSWNQL